MSIESLNPYCNEERLLIKVQIVNSDQERVNSIFRVTVLKLYWKKKSSNDYRFVRRDNGEFLNYILSYVLHIFSSNYNLTKVFTAVTAGLYFERRLLMKMKFGLKIFCSLINLSKVGY